MTDTFLIAAASILSWVLAALLGFTFVDFAGILNWVGTILTL